MGEKPGGTLSTLALAGLFGRACSSYWLGSMCMCSFSCSALRPLWSMKHVDVSGRTPAWVISVRTRRGACGILRKGKGSTVHVCNTWPHESLIVCLLWFYRRFHDCIIRDFVRHDPSRPHYTNRFQGFEEIAWRQEINQSVMHDNVILNWFNLDLPWEEHPFIIILYEILSASSGRDLIRDSAVCKIQDIYIYMYIYNIYMYIYIYIYSWSPGSV
jgi:hypothetical protein